MLNLTEYKRRNNLTSTRLARYLGISPNSVSFWERSGKLPAGREEELIALERDKRATGELPLADRFSPEVRETWKRYAEKARSARSPEGIARAAARGGEYLSQQRVTARANSRWSVCKRNFEEVAAAELESAGRRLGWWAFYLNTFKTERGTFKFEGKKQSYEFD